MSGNIIRIWRWLCCCVGRTNCKSNGIIRPSRSITALYSSRQSSRIDHLQGEECDNNAVRPTNPIRRIQPFVSIHLHSRSTKQRCAILLLTPTSNGSCIQYASCSLRNAFPVTHTLSIPPLQIVWGKCSKSEMEDKGPTRTGLVVDG